MPEHYRVKFRLRNLTRDQIITILACIALMAALVYYAFVEKAF